MRPELVADLAVCEGILARGSKSFGLAARLLPPEIRARATALYAFCRVADDAIDAGGDVALALTLLEKRVAAACDGAPLDSPVDRALAFVVHECAIPRALPLALLEGFSWDAEGRRYETLDAVLDYAARVAGAVGAMMALVMGTRDPSALARACDLGVAMQLTNIARDVGDDARLGRLYLPGAWLKQVNIDPDEWLAHPRFDTGIARAVERLLDVARPLYRRADAGVGDLPRRCRPAIRAAARIYEAIGGVVRTHRYDSFSRRAVVPFRRKVLIASTALAPELRRPGLRTLPALAATGFLVSACAARP